MMSRPGFRFLSITALPIAWGWGLIASPVSAQVPDHPVISEVYCDPPGLNDGPVGRQAGNLNQEYIELYLPTAAQLAIGLNKDALRLAFYEIEGDEDSTGAGLVNYRIDLPTFDLDPSNGITAGALPRPTNGVVVLGWVDYVGNPPTALAGTASTRIALINGGITSAADFTFIAINGAQFGGTTNFPVPVAISYINMPAEAGSGMIQNGSGVYLLVNRDAAGYVALTDDADPAGGNHDPSLSTNTVLQIGCLLDGWGPNDSNRFDILDQPSGDGNNDNFMNLPPGGAFSLRVCQMPEDDKSTIVPGVANGYARRLVDVRRTTEDANGANDDPITDSVNNYRQIRNDGAFYPTPGRVALTNTAPELGVATAAAQQFSVLAGTTAQPGIFAANVGGNYLINVSASVGGSSNPPAALFANSAGVTDISGQSNAFPPISVQVPMTATHGATSNTTATVTAVNANGSNPAVVAPIQQVQATATVLKPTTGLNAAGQAFQTTVFVAVQPILSGPALNEFSSTSLAQWVGSRLGNQAQETWGNALTLLNPATDFSSPALIRPMVRQFPGTELEYVNPAGPAGRLDLVQTVLQSAEMQSGAATYADVFNATQTALRATRVNTPDNLTFGGTFTPTEPVYFIEPTGRLPGPRSGLYRATTARTFEVAMIDTNVPFVGPFESGATDDVGVVVEALDVEPGSPVVPGEFIFLSISGGLQGADIDGMEVLPGASVVANIVYFDLDNLHDVLGVRSMELMWLVDAGGATNEIDPIEAFALNPVAQNTPCPGDVDGNRVINLTDLAVLLAHFGTLSGATLADGDFDADGDVDLSDLAFLLANFGLTCP